MCGTVKALPNLQVLDEEGRKVSVRDLIKGWTILYVYPKDNTPGCTTEAKEFTDLLPEFKALGFEVIGVSRDSPDSHRRFKEKHNLKVKLVSDPEAELIKALGAWGVKKAYGRSYEGVIRSTYIVSPSGKVVWEARKVRAKGHAAKVLQVVKELLKGGPS
ncbi:MAG: peroxiredoxin [Desulfurococcales archaeon]|nr:peroxiredoxin [Desulfurococcales archaeon]